MNKKIKCCLLALILLLIIPYLNTEAIMRRSYSRSSSRSHFRSKPKTSIKLPKVNSGSTSKKSSSSSSKSSTTPKSNTTSKSNKKVNTNSSALIDIPTTYSSKSSSSYYYYNVSNGNRFWSNFWIYRMLTPNNRTYMNGYGEKRIAPAYTGFRSIWADIVFACIFIGLIVFIIIRLKKSSKFRSTY